MQGPLVSNLLLGHAHDASHSGKIFVIVWYVCWYGAVAAPGLLMLLVIIVHPCQFSFAGRVMTFILYFHALAALFGCFLIFRATTCIVIFIGCQLGG